MNRKNSLNQKRYVFKKWTNKAYAIFNSLKRNCKIAVLPLIYVMLVNSPVLSQTDTIDLEEITINQTRVPKLYSELSRTIYIIDKQQISNSSNNSIEDLLQHLANVDVRSRGAAGTQSDISIRGGSFEQTLILINGVKFNDPQTGHFAMNLPIDITDIERIEVLQGAGARIYGINAFAGAINIITKNTNKNYFSASFYAAQHDLFVHNISMNFKYKKFANYLSINNKKCDGYITNTDFSVLNIFYQANYNSKLAKIMLQTGSADKDFGANSFYSAKYPEQYELNNTYFANIKAEIGHKLKITPSLYWRQNNDIFQLFREGEPWYQKSGNYYIKNNTDTAKYYKNIYEKWNYYSGHNFHLSATTGAELNLSFSSKAGKTAMGIEYRQEKIISNKLGETTDSTEVPFLKDEYFTRAHTRNNTAFFIDHFIKIKKIDFATGVLFNLNSDFKFNYYTGFDASYRITRTLKAIFSINQAMRIPTFTDLYYQSATNIGNINLLPEEALTYETGIKYKKKMVTTNIAFFIRDGKNIIDWIKINQQDKWEVMNHTHLITYGAEINTNIIFPKNLFIENINIAYSYLIADKQEDKYISNYALDYLTHNFNLGIYHKIHKKIYATWTFAIQDRNGTYSRYDLQTASTSEQDYKIFFLLNGKIFWTNKFINLFVETTNILNQEYYDFGNILMPKRWTGAGIKVYF